MGEVDQKGRDLATVDVTIRGAGVFGLSVAYACAKRGARVRVIDPGGVAAGASGGVVGALAPHTPEHWNAKKAFQFQCLIGAAGYWRGIEELSGLSSGYGRHGRLQPIADARALEFAKRRAESSVALWGEHAVWEIVEAGEWAPVSATGLCIHDTLSGRIDPKRGCLALAGAIEALGGEVCLDGRDEGAVVWATGAAGLADLSAQMGAVVGMGQKGQAAVLEYDARGLPQLFAEGIHVIPHAVGTVAV
jgi:glycine/D-amino acid oxidase-like deaminating enzyme